MKKTVVSLLLLILFTGLSFAQSQHKVKDKQLDEISGIAASRANQGYYYVHNDSGGKSQVYIINGKGKTVGNLSIPAVANRDWEDIAVGPDFGMDKQYIYVGEIGDNKAKYENLCFYRIEEPTKQFSGKGAKPFSVNVEADSIGFVYEDGPKDCETLMIDPANGDVYLVSKREEKVGVYLIKAPLSTDSLNVAKRLLSLDFALAVGGDISPQRDKIIIKTYNKVYQWRIKPEQSIAEALSGAYEILPYKVEPQGEAICYSADGKSYLTISEKAKKKPLYLYKYPLKN